VDDYSKFPRSLNKSLVLLLDPMLATGGSATAALTFLKRKGAQRIRFVSLLAAPEGVKKLTKHHPDVPVFTAVLDRELNSHGYILPGLGDAGDRIFGTE
jgi:uracil phosphoribosyltransferase